MSDFVPRPICRVTRSRVTGGLIAGWLGCLAASMICCMSGCGKSKDNAQQAPAKKYEVADDSDQGVTPAAQPAPESIPSVPSSRVGEDGSGQMATPGSLGGTSVPTQPPIQPPPLPQGEPEQITVPDGTPAELLAFIDELGRKIEGLQVEMQGQPRSVVVARMQGILEALLTAAEKILASNDVDQAARRRAIDTKAGAMSVLSQLAPDGKWGEKVKEFGTTLATDKDPAVAIEGRTILFGILLGDLVQGRSRDYDGLMTQLKSLLQQEALSDVVFDISMQSVYTLRNLGQDDKAREAFGLTAVAFKDHPDPQLAREAARMAEQVLFLDKDMEAKFNSAVLNREGAADVFLGEIDAMLKRPDAGSLTLEKGARYVSMLEQTAHYELAGKLCGMIQDAFQTSQDEMLQKAAAEVTKMARCRLDLIGKPLAIEASRLDGGSLDFAAYQGKPVLVAFFKALDPRCQQELANVKSAYEKYHDQGFDVIGVSLDTDRNLLNQYLAEAKLPWVTVTNNKLAENLGVEMIPFCLFLGQDGKVTDIYLQGPALSKKLTELFGPGPVDAPATPAPPTSDPPGDQSRNLRSKNFRERTSGLVAFDLLAPSQAVTQSPADTLVHGTAVYSAATEDTTSQSPQVITRPGDGDDGDGDNSEQDELAGLLADVNPYVARPGLSDSELIQYLFDMQEKPKSIRQRPGFADATVEAAQRVLAGSGQGKYQLIAAEAIFSTLHETACLGHDDADQRLLAFVESMADDKRPEIAQRVEFYRLEYRVLQADQLPLQQVPVLLADLLSYVEAQRKLDGRHLRLASATVHAINRLEDEAEREKYFTEFGKLFAKSDDRQLARYGKKLEGGGKRQVSDLVGKPLELEGMTDLGTPFDWSSYRGKVVLVDFWATWCGPCLTEFTHLRTLHERLASAGLEVVAVSVDEDLEALAKFLQENKVPWANLVGEEARALATKYEVRGIPTMMLVDKTGQVVAVGNKVETLESQIQKLMEAPAE